MPQAAQEQPEAELPSEWPTDPEFEQLIRLFFSSVHSEAFPAMSHHPRYIPGHAELTLCSLYQTMDSSPSFMSLLSSVLWLDAKSLGSLAS